MKYMILLVVGIIIGGVAAIFFLGVPSARAIPGSVVQAPAAGGDPPGTVVVSISNSFFNELLGTIFRDLSPPTFQLAKLDGATNSPFTQATFQGGCANSITLAPDGSNAKTQVQFVNGKISAPLVFGATYNAAGCMQFKGWAQTTMQLSFDQSSQTLYGRLVVDGVELEGVNPFANALVTTFVRGAIDSKLNPIQLLRPQQLQLMIPVQSSNGSVKATVKDVRSEVQDNQLRLHITYEFSGSKGQQPTG